MANRLRGISLAVVLGAALCLADPAQAQRIYVRVPPPPVQVEVRPAVPDRHHVWVGGYHRWDGHAYVWVPGRWDRPPHARTVWVSGHWSHHRRGWHWVPGHWRRR